MLIIMRGYPGSGKTTCARAYVAENKRAIRLNRDDFRSMMYGLDGVLAHEQEQAVTVAQHAAIKASLEAGKTVLVDDTNLKLRHARALADLAVNAGTDFIVVDFDDVPVEECIRRDALRERPVGEEVIRSMARRFPYKQWKAVEPTQGPKLELEPYVPKWNTPRAILVDVDGTLAHNEGHRDYYDYSEALLRDTVHEEIANLVYREHNAGLKVIVMSGRAGRRYTQEWLEHHGIPFDLLLTRSEKDFRSDAVIKSELFNAHVRDNYCIEYVLDDRRQVVQMWRSMGLRVLQVADGNF